MIEDMIVVDAVVHPYDLAPQNQDPAARAQLETVYAAHRMSFDPPNQQYMLSHEEFFSDFPYDALAYAEFVESPVDLAVIHALPNLGMVLKNMTDPDRAAAVRDSYPNRFRLYATVDTPIVTEDFGATLFRMGKARGTMTASQVSAGRKNGLVLEIYGTKGGASWRQECPEELWLGHRDTRRYNRAGRGRRLPERTSRTLQGAVRAERTPRP